MTIITCLWFQNDLDAALARYESLFDDFEVHSTMRMGDDPRTSAVSSQGAHHSVKGLFVADGSLFPTSLGGPPQISIYAFALHLAPHVVAYVRRSM